MKIQLVFVFLVFFLKHKVTYATNWPIQRYSKLNVYLQGFSLESYKVNTIFECYAKCEENIHCASINLNLTDNTCELKSSSKTRHPEKIVHRQNAIYMEIRDHFTPVSEPENPTIVSCKHLKQNNFEAKSGVYWMKFNEPSSAPFQVFCDMTTDGGGWTLVWSYTFTQYSSFSGGKNAVTPIPNWPMDTSSKAWVPQSMKTPLDESSHSAMDFSVWKKIGSAFLVKSNITNWVACAEGTGSLVNWVEGSVTCRVVNAITPTCTTVTPNVIGFFSCGPALDLDSEHYIYFEGRTDKCRPVHDSCGTNSRSVAKGLANVPSPNGGAIYVR